MGALMALIQLIFQSTLMDESSADLSEIFHTARLKNRSKGITGLIMCAGTQFFQVLEGDSSVVNHTYQRICADTRHQVTHAWGDSDIKARHFNKWVSGFRRVKLGARMSDKLEEAYFFDDYDLSQLREHGGLMQSKLYAFHRATVEATANISPFSFRQTHAAPQALAA